MFLKFFHGHFQRKQASRKSRCPVGYHWVKRHDRQKETLEDVDPHCRRNFSNKDLIKADEMDLIAMNNLFRNPPVKVSDKDLKLHMVSIETQNQYDELISGWTAYWNDVFKLKEPLHPNHVKALMATESTFNPKAIAKNTNPKTGFARGLMQITERTVREMKGEKKDYRNHLVDLEYDDLWDANKNICAAVRHLFRKRETAKSKLKREPTWFEVLMDYKGWLKGESQKAIETKEKLAEYFLKMGMNPE